MGNAKTKGGYDRDKFLEWLEEHKPKQEWPAGLDPEVIQWKARAAVQAAKSDTLFLSAEFRGIINNITDHLKQQKRWVPMKCAIMDGSHVVDVQNRTVGTLIRDEAETKAECDRRNGLEGAKPKYRAVSDGIIADKVGHILTWKQLTDATEKKKILNALNGETKEGE